MASIVGKRVSGKTHYYLVESARVDGKPRIVSQQYLGSAEAVTARLAGTQTGAPVRTQHKGFGGLAAVWGVLQRLDVVGLIDAAVPRYPTAGASVGTYLALATANRVVAPCSKLAFADWWATTAGPRWLKLPDAALDHRRFWEAMDRLGVADLRAVEAEIGQRIVTEFGLELSGLVLDMTNFATFIDSTNDKAPIAQRGKAKQNAPTCGWSAWVWSSPATAASPSCRKPIRATVQTSPSSPRLSTNWSPATGDCPRPWTP